jgi:hypothetical protein
MVISYTTARSFKNLLVRFSVRFLRRRFSVRFPSDLTRSYMISRQDLTTSYVWFFDLGTVIRVYPGQKIGRKILSGQIKSYGKTQSQKSYIRSYCKILERSLLSYKILYNLTVISYGTARSFKNLTVRSDVTFLRLRFSVRFFSDLKRSHKIRGTNLVRSYCLIVWPE